MVVMVVHVHRICEQAQDCARWLRQLLNTTVRTRYLVPHFVVIVDVAVVDDALLEEIVPQRGPVVTAAFVPKAMKVLQIDAARCHALFFSDALQRFVRLVT